MKILKFYFLFVFMLISTVAYSKSYYYYEDFSSEGSEWVNNFYYDRDGAVIPTDGNESQTFTGGILELRGHNRQNSGSYDRNGYWIGRKIFNTNTYNASKICPFGYEIKRLWSDLDFEVGDNASPGDSRRHVSSSIWLFQDNEPPLHKTFNTDRSNEWEQFENFMQFSDTIGVWEDNYAEKRISRYAGVEVVMNMSNAVGPDGRIWDISGPLDWDYGMNNNNSTPNTNNIGFRIINDSEYFYFYINPDPDDNDASLPDEWLLVDKTPATWFSNMQFMIGGAQKANDANSGNGRAHKYDADFDDLLVRSADDDSIAAFNPSQILISTNVQNITLTLTNTILANNAGINYIHITTPTNIKWPSSVLQNLTNFIVVRDHYDNNITERTLTTVWYQPGSFPANNEVAILTNSAHDFYLLLGSQITNMTTDSENISIDMQIVQSNEFDPPLHFSVSVMAEQFDAMATSQKQKYSTAGWQLCSGTPDLYRKLDPAAGYASITPNEIIQGSSSYNFTYYIGSGDKYTEDIKQVAIAIPPDFTVNTNSIDSFLLSSDSSYITITTNSKICGISTNLIFIDYASAGQSIPAGGGLDTITFSVKGTVSKGLEQWKSFVDGTAVDSSSAQSKTNATFQNQFVKVLGAPPDVAAGITKPVNADPVVLFNTITANTLEYTIENRAGADEVDNQIWAAVLTVPAIFTNIQIISDDKLSNGANIVLNQGMGNVSTITLFYCNENNPINPGGTDSDTLTILTYHSLTNYQTTNVSFSLVVNNSNGQGYLTNTIDMIQDLQVTDPYPMGTVDCQPADGIVYTSDVTNVFTYKIYNSAPSGKILYADINMPTNYFSNLINVESSLVANGISTSGLNIHVDYTVDNVPIDVGQVDTISFTAVDKYTNIAIPDSVIIPSKVANNTRTNATTDKDSGLGLTRTIDFVPQEARVYSYLTNENLVRTEVTTSTLYYVFHNYGDEGNVVSYAEGSFTGSGGGGDISSITKVTSAFGGLWSTSGLTFSKMNYNLPAGQKDVVKIIIDDSISSETYRDILPQVTVNTSTLVSTACPSGKTNRVYFKIPPPKGKGCIYPNQLFVSSALVTNYFSYKIFNAGTGNNELERAILYIPAFLNGMVSALSNSWMNSTVYITNYADKIVLDYTNFGNNLNTGATDTVYLKVVHSGLSKSNVSFALKVENNDGKGEYATIDLVPDGNILNLVGQPDGYIESPTSILDSSVSNTITYKILNPATGQNVVSARIKVPTSVYTLNPSSLSSAWLGSTVSYSNLTDYIYVDLSANPLFPNNVASVSFKVSDTINKITNTTIWPSDVAYSSNGAFLHCGINSGSQKMVIQLDSASAKSRVSPTQVLVAGSTNSLSYYIVNTGNHENYIREALISFPPSEVIIKNGSLLSSVLTNESVSAIVSNSVGKIYLKYFMENNLVTSMTDILNFDIIDTISNTTSCTLKAFVDNGDGNGFVPTSSFGGGQVLSFVPSGVYGYISPTSLDSTTLSNQFTYQINNSGASVKMIVIDVPPEFTNISYVHSSHLGNQTYIHPTGLGNISSITLDYFGDGNTLDDGEEDTITIEAHDSVDYTSSVSTWNSYSSNNLGMTPILVTSGLSQTVTFSMPQTYGQFGIVPNNCSTVIESGNYTNYIYNYGNGLNNILMAKIFIPNVYTNILSIASDFVSSNDISINSNSITIYYTNNPLPTSATDKIILNLADNIVLPTNLTWNCLVANTYDTNDFVSANILPGYSKNITYTKPTVKSYAYVKTNTISAFTTDNLFSVVISNAGVVNNDIYKVKITPPTFFTNVTSLTSSKLGLTHIIYSNSVIYVDYSSNTLKGHEKDTIQFMAFDNISVETSAAWMVSADNYNGSGFVNSTEWLSKGQLDLNVFVPVPNTKISVTPNLIFEDTVTNTYVLKLTNAGYGINPIKKAIVTLPSSVTIAQPQSAWLNNDGANIMLNNSSFTLFYSSDSHGSLTTGNTDIISFKGIDSYTGDSTTFNVDVSVDNGSGVLTSASPVSSDANSVKVIYRPTASVLPSEIESESITNQISYSIKNAGSQGENIQQVKILIPDHFVIVSNSLSASLLTSITNVSYGSNFILLDYANDAGDFSKTLTETITFDVIDDLVKVTNTSFWESYVNYNDGTGFHSTFTTPSKSKSIFTKFSLPSASVNFSSSKFYTTSTTDNLTCVIQNTGKASNYISRIRLYFPNSKISINASDVTSTLVDSANILSVSNYIKLQYKNAGNVLSAQTSDTLHIRMIDSINSVSSVTLNCMLDNSVSGNGSITNQAIGDRIIDFGTPPDVSVTPVNVNTAIQTNIQLTYKIHNNSFQDVKKAVIFLPTAVTNYNNVHSSVFSNTNNIMKGVSSFTLNYAGSSAGKLSKGTSDYVTFNIRDNIDKGNTNLDFLSFVDAGQGLSATITNVDTTKKVSFSMPNASANAYILPNKITTVSLSNDFIYVISNRGFGSDRIDKVKITIPSGFTGVSNISGHFFINNSSIEKGSGYFAINYYAENSYIPSHTVETLKFRAFDSITTVGDYDWSLQVDNMSGANLQPTSIPSGQKQIVSTVVPDFTAKVSIAPNYIYSTIETNHIFNIYLENQSLNNQLNQAKIILPTPELNTNVVISSTVLGTSNISRSNNVILLDYIGAGLPLAAGGGDDTITIKAFDTYTNNISSNNWGVEVKHITAIDFNSAQLLTPSDSFKLVLQMPDAKAKSAISPQNIYTVQTNITFVYTVSNVGFGKNYITELQIHVPEFFTNGLTSANIHSPRPGATVGYNSLTSIATVNYLGNMLPVGVKDKITLTNIHNSCTNATNGILWESYVKNGPPDYSATNTSEKFYQSKSIDVKVSSARCSMVVATISNQNFIYTTDISNQMKVTIRNTGNDGDFIKQLFIHIPTALLSTNIYNISSENIAGTFISLPTDGSPITLNYSSGGYAFGYGDSDTITFTMRDNITAETSMYFNAQANFSNNLGYISAEEFYPGAKYISVINPPLQARVELKTPVIYTSESNVNRTIQFSVLNKGVGLNDIYFVKLQFIGPYVPFITKIDSPHLNTYSISNIDSTNIIATLNYQLSPHIQSQTEEIITISMSNYLIPEEHYNLEIKSWLKNSLSGSYFLPTEQGDTTLDIIYGNKTVYKASIVYDSQVKNDDATIYTINHSANINYEILNKSPKWDIEEALIQLAPYMTNVQIHSFEHPTANISLSNNLAHIIYQTNDLLLFGSYDTVEISFNYNETLTNVTAMSSSVKFNDGSGFWHSHYRTNEQALYLKEAFWGQLEGHVFPTFKAINVKLYDVNTGKQVINVFTNSILYTTSDSNGNYKMDLIPEGIYNVKYYDEEGQFLSSFYMTNVPIYSNQITTLPQVYMKNAPIRSSAPSGTCIYCYDDNEQSYLCVPSESVFSDFYLDIYIQNMTEAQKAKLKANSSILVSDTVGLQIFNFDLRDLSQNSLDNTKLKLTGQLTLHYDSAFVASKGWNEKDLAVYYWNDKLHRWIKLGGTVDTAMDTVKVNVNYLNSVYAILPSVNTETGDIQNVTIAPNPFTPLSTDGTFNTVSLSFILTTSVQNVYVNIFNLKGELVRKITNIDATQGNIIVWWDGKDNNGYYVPGGAYLYQIRADKSVYSGTILLLK